MRRIWATLMVAFCLAAKAQGGEVSDAELKQILLRLETKVERLSAQVQAQSEQIEAQRAEIARLRAVFAPQPVAAPVAAELPLAMAAPESIASLIEPVQEKQPAPRAVAGVRFSGNFRYRFDVGVRHPNEFAPALQNIRARYRFHLNLDREIADRLRFHLQLASGALTNSLVDDQDFTSTVAKHLFTISEAYVDYQPAAGISLRGGRMEEVFSDRSRFLFDNDVRLNGFHQIVRVGERLEFRAGQYIFTNPVVLRVEPGSPLALAGARVGSRGRAANLFHQGFVFRTGPHQFIADLQLYRNPNQLQLSLITAGVGLNSAGLGVQLPAPFTGLGNATTTPGGAQLTAGHYQIVRLAYGLSGAVPVLGVPYGRLYLQVSRNVGAGKLRDAMMATAQLGQVKKRGDVSGLYAFAIKDANSLLGALTDSELGTQSNVNIRSHHFRVDLGLASFLQWQNLLFISNSRRSSNPAERFFVPFQRGARETVRFQSFLAFAF